MKDYIDRLVQGEMNAWKDFIQQYGAILHAGVLKTLRKNGIENPETLNQLKEDIIQEVFEKLVKNDYRNLRNYDSKKSAPSTWLTIIAYSCTIDHLRKSKKEELPGDEIIQNLAETPPEQPPMPDLPLEILSPRQQLVLHLLFDKQMTVEEAADYMEVKEQTIRSTKHKAILKLRKAVKSPQGDVNGIVTV